MSGEALSTQRRESNGSFLTARRCGRKNAHVVAPPRRADGLARGRHAQRAEKLRTRPLEGIERVLHGRGSVGRARGPRKLSNCTLAADDETDAKRSIDPAMASDDAEHATVLSALRESFAAAFYLWQSSINAFRGIMPYLMGGILLLSILASVCMSTYSAGEKLRERLKKDA